MAKCCQLRKLKQFLQSVDGFENPRAALEQYVTPSYIASRMLFMIQSKYGDISRKAVLDLGCGTGMLSVGASVLGASQVVGVEFDPKALEVFKRNVRKLKLHNVEGVHWDVLNLDGLYEELKFDTVVMHPPVDLDVEFLRVALNIAKHSVYSLHKSSNRAYIKKKAAEWGRKGSVIAPIGLDVDLWRFETGNV